MQTKTDTKWTVAGKKIELDTNVQNSKSSNIGFWKKDESYVLPHERNTAVHSALRFVCEGKPMVFDDAGNSKVVSACTTPFGVAVRTFGANPSGTLIKVDCDEDGNIDGWMKLKDLSEKRPTWVNNAARAQTHCLAQ